MTPAESAASAGPAASPAPGPAGSTPFLSYARNHEDVVLYRLLGDLGAGRYLDIGAGGPTVGSRSRAFYDRGWRGLTVDRSPEQIARQALERPEDRSVLAQVGPEPATDNDSGAAAERGPAPARRLDAILADAGWQPDAPIHFMTVDVGGRERGVLDSLDLHTWRPWVLVVATPISDPAVSPDWEPQLTDAGYRCCLFDGLNRFHLAAEHAELAPALGYPACALDHFVTVEQEEEQRAIAAALAERDRLRTRWAALTRAVRDGGIGPVGALASTIAEVEALEQAALADAVRWRSRAVRDYRRQPSAVSGPVGSGPVTLSDELRLRIADLQRQIGELKATISWRVTAPLRVVRQLRPRGRR